MLALKGNQGRLAEQVKQFFTQTQANQFAGIAHEYHETVDGGHGRVEVRRYCEVDPIHWTVGRKK